MSTFKTCPTCRYYLKAVVEDNKLMRICKSCGYEEEDKGGLIMESYIKEKSSESYKILLNEFTRQDPTLPYLKDLKCLLQGGSTVLILPLQEEFPDYTNGEFKVVFTLCRKSL